jgi:hypothetical protein
MAVLPGTDSGYAGSKVLAEAAKQYRINGGCDRHGSEHGVCREGKAKAAKKNIAKPQGKVTKKTTAG